MPQEATGIRIPGYVLLKFKQQHDSSAFRANCVAREVESCRAWFVQSPIECLATFTRYIGRTYVHKSRNKDYFASPMGRTQQYIQTAVCRWISETPPDDFGAAEALEWCRTRLGVLSAAHNWGQKYQAHHPDGRNRFRGRVTRELGSCVSLAAQDAMAKLRQKMEQLNSHLEATRVPPGPRTTEPPVPNPSLRRQKRVDAGQMALF